MKTKSLWFVGLACMAGGGLARFVVSKPTDRADAMAQDLGMLLVMLVGVGLVIAHFVRTKKPRR